MMNRREFLLSAAAAATACGRDHPKLTSKERVDRALRGEELDRPPFTFYYHFGLQDFPGERHAQATLDFHRKFKTDLVKVMSDFPYPKPEGKWFELRVVENPFPEEIRALEIIRDGLGGENHFIETIFNPWNQAEKLSSKEEVARLKDEDPQALLDALEVIAKSEAAHARRAIEAGASGVFLAIANAQQGVLSEEEYAKFSEPFDKLVLEAVSDAPLNTLHIHGDKVYLDRFHSGWAASVLQYTVHGTGVPISRTRQSYDGVLLGGLDERNFRDLSPAELREQWQAAQQAAGSKFILAPGCSVPNETADEELMRVVDLLVG
jgi:uroporphyrinogen decarboxylase